MASVTTSLTATKQEARLANLLADSARFLLVGAIFTAVWGVGGYFPIARFMTLTLLTTAAITTCFSGIASRQHLRAVMPLLLVMLAALVYGLLQLIPDSGTDLLSWTGVREIQQRFGGLGSGEPVSQSLVSWMTQDWLAMAVIGMIGYFLAASLFNDDSSRILLLAAVAICGIGQVFWGVIQLSAFPNMIFWGVENPSETSVPFGTFLNRNHAADFIGMSLACLIGLARWRFASEVHRWNSGYGVASHFRAVVANPLTLSIWLGVIWLGLGMVLSFSRGGWAAGIVAMAIVPLCWKRTGKTQRSLLLIPVFLILASVYAGAQFFGFGDQIDHRLDDLEVQNLMTDSRFDHWAEAMPAAKHYLPFGAGLGTYGYAYLPFEPEPERGWFSHAHNQYLEVLMEAGIPGIILLALALFFAARAALRLCGSDRSVSKQALGIAAMGALALQAFHAITDFGLMMPGNLLTFCVLLGAACASAGEKRSSTRKKRSRATRQVRKAAMPTGPDAEATTEKKSNTPVGRRKVLTLLLNAIVLCAVCLALWQQGRHVRAANLIQKTSFSPATPSPTVEKAAERIELLQDELKKWPQYEPLMRRLISLQMHRAQRTTYDQIRSAEVPEGVHISPINAWDNASLEAVVIRLFDDSEAGPAEDVKEGLKRLMQEEPNLAKAWKDAERSLSLNPVQPRTHMRMAQLAASSGRDWEKPFHHSSLLAVVDPSQSLGNGLLAWAAGDVESMVEQWRRTLATDWAPMDLIYKLSSLRISEDEIVDRLMPDRWSVPFRLSQSLTEQESTDEFRAKLLDRAKSIAKNTMQDEFALYRTLGLIAVAEGNPSEASGHYEKAIKSDPRDPEIRHLAAVALHRDGRTKQAVGHSRVATMLAPKNSRFRDYYERLIRFHHRQYTKKSKQPE